MNISANKLISIALIALLSGCENYTAGGAVAGAAIGGAIARSQDSSNSRTAASAAIGAVLGGALGNYMSQQKQELESALINEQAQGVQITQLSDGTIKIYFPSEMAFAVNNPQFYPQFGYTLDRVAEILNRYVQTNISVVGHTDSTGSLTHNMTLSNARAVSVAQHLNNRGVMINRLSTSGMGPNQPIADNATTQGRALNRRVEMFIRPIQ